MKTVPASKLLNELGIRHNLGTAHTLKQLQKFGVKPVDHKVYARGVMWMISDDDYKRVVKEQKEASEGLLPRLIRGQVPDGRSDIRVVASALCHLFALLGESPPKELILVAGGDK